MKQQVYWSYLLHQLLLVMKHQPSYQQQYISHHLHIIQQWIPHSKHESQAQPAFKVAWKNFTFHNLAFQCIKQLRYGHLSSCYFSTLNSLLSCWLVMLLCRISDFSLFILNSASDLKFKASTTTVSCGGSREALGGSVKPPFGSLIRMKNTDLNVYFCSEVPFRESTNPLSNPPSQNPGSAPGFYCISWRLWISKFK